jgi:hypothetical protein
MASSLPLEDAKAMLDITDAKYDTELQRKIDAIEISLERVLGGPVVSRQFTERAELTDGGTALMLRKRPVVSVQSIVPVSTGAAIGITDLDIDPNSNIVRRRLGLPFTIGFMYVPVVTVTYTAGLGSTAPADVIEAAQSILKYLWYSRRGASPGNGPSTEQLVSIPGMTYAIPNRAAELLAARTLEAYV